MASERIQPLHKGTRCDPRHFLSGTRTPLRDRTYEILRDVIKSLARNGTLTIIDVGGYIGSFIIPMVLGARQDGIDVTAHCLEPGPTGDVLKINVEFNGLENIIQVHEIAISDVVGHVIYGLSSGSAVGATVFQSAKAELQRVVPAKTLDEFFRVHSISGPCFIKLDTQGHEPAIMRASPETTTRADTAWLIEFIYWSAKIPIEGWPFHEWLSDRFQISELKAPNTPLNKESTKDLVTRLTEAKDGPGHEYFTDLILTNPRKRPA